MRKIATLVAGVAAALLFGSGIAHADCHTTCSDDGSGTSSCDSWCDD